MSVLCRLPLSLPARLARGTTVGAITGAIFGTLFDEREALKSVVSGWSLSLRLLWETHFTKEWNALAPLIDEQEELNDTPFIETTTSSCQLYYGLVYDSPHRYQTEGVWKT